MKPAPPEPTVELAAPHGHATAKVVVLAEFAAAALTWGVWELAEAAGVKVFVFPLVLLAWVSYFAAKALRRPHLWEAWGLRVGGWRRAIKWHAAATLLALAVVAALGLVNQRFVAPRDALILMLLYPAWAFCQQFVLQNGVVANARTLGVPRGLLPLVGMLAFAAVHVPNLPLVGLTALGGLLWTWLWLRAPNLWLLALGHSVVGTAGFLLVLDRDPLLNFQQVAQLAAWP